jgi:hypothetical protein
MQIEKEISASENGRCHGAPPLTRPCLHMGAHTQTNTRALRALSWGGEPERGNRVMVGNGGFCQVQCVMPAHDAAIRMRRTHARTHATWRRTHAWGSCNVSGVQADGQIRCTHAHTHTRTHTRRGSSLSSAGLLRQSDTPWWRRACTHRTLAHQAPLWDMDRRSSDVDRRIIWNRRRWSHLPAHAPGRVSET